MTDAVHLRVERARHAQALGLKRGTHRPTNRRLRRLAATHVRGLIRADVALTVGFDLSRYDEQAAVDLAAFVIVNVDDPDLSGKVGRAIGQGKPWGGYKWIYPGANGWGAATECASKLAAFGTPPLGSWADYEDNGVDQGQLVAWFGGLDSVGARGGYYSNDWRVDHAQLIRDVGVRWYWTAGYPGNNDGTFPGWSALRTSRPAQLWQFTSTNGTRDQNAVVDLAWYAGLGGTTGGGIFDMLTEDEQRRILNFADLCMNGAPQFGVPKLLPAIAAIERDTASSDQYGIKAAPAAIAELRNDLMGLTPLLKDKPTTRALLEAAALNASTPDPTHDGDVWTDEEKAAVKARADNLREIADALYALVG